MGTQSQRDWAIGGGLETKVKYAGFFADLSLQYSHGRNFSESVGVIESTNFTQFASAYTSDKIVYFGTPYQVWEYPVFVEGTREPVDYLTVMFPADDGTGSTRAADTTMGDYPEAPWYRAGHQTYNAWSYDPVGTVGFPDYDPSQSIVDTDCAGGGCGFTFAEENVAFRGITKTKTHDFSTEVGGGYETGPEAKLIGLEASMRAYVNGSYHQSDIETEKQTTSENTDIDVYINGTPPNSAFTTRVLGYWAPDGHLVLDYQTDMPAHGDWAAYYSGPDPAFLLPWSGFPYGDDPLPPIAGLEFFSPEVQISPKSSSVGETVVISATVRNFSSVGASDVKVRFCLGDPGPTCEPPDGEAYIDEETIPLLDRGDGPVTVSVAWEASGLGEQRIYAVIDPDNTIDPEVHDEDDLINNNVAYGLAKIGAAVIVDQGLASERPYQDLGYDQGDSWMVSAYVPPGNLSEVVHFELRDSSLYVPNAVGKPFELVSFEGDEFREEPNYDLTLKPESTDPPAVIGLAQSGTSVAGLTLYQAMDQAGSNWMEAACAGYPVQRFDDENLIFVPVCRAGIFVFAETPPGPTPAPVADFSAIPTSGPVPLTVAFTDQSSNYPTSWLWDFGDGWTSTEQNPSHLYEVPGTYTVTLSVSSPGGSDTEIKANHVNATGQLAAFSADPVLGSAPLTVSFTDQSSGNPALTSWDWDFGDSGTSTDQHPEHTYTTTGTFTVTLTVANTAGSDTLTVPDCIAVYLERLIFLPVVLRGGP
jgi:hypothetical protein